MSALGKVVRAGVGRKRVQTLVMVLTTMAAVTACILATGLLVASQGPYQRSFADQHGAHLNVLYDPTKASPAQLAATAHTPGVTASAGPYPALSVQPRAGADVRIPPPGSPLPPMTLVGRAKDGPMDGLRITMGRWVAGPGEVVFLDGHSPLAVGDSLQFPDLPGHPTLKVVGLATSVSWSADGWIAPEQVAALTAPGTKPAAQYLYRFAHADNDTEVEADRAALAAAVPGGALAKATSHRPAQAEANRTAATFVPFVTAFGVLGLAMSVLIIGVVVSGAVSAATRRIGILKSLGFTPAQVARAYVGQALIPAGVGTALGVLGGNLLSVPVLGVAHKALRGGLLGIPLWVDVVVPAVALAAVTGTALVPALRAGRLRTVEALAVGRTAPGARRAAARGGPVRAGAPGPIVRLQHLIGRLPVPRALSLGLATPLTRPARSATTAAAVVLGTAGVALCVGLTLSLGAFQDGLQAERSSKVVVQIPIESSTKAVDHVDEAAVAKAITTRPGTRAWYSSAPTPVAVAGNTGRSAVIAFTGDASWSGYQMISGRWFQGPGEAVVATSFLRTNQVRVGDTVTLTDNGRSIPVRISGEVLTTNDLVFVDRATLAPLGTAVQTDAVGFHIDLTPGTDAKAYADGLDDAVRPLGLSAETGGQQINIVMLAMNTLAGTLTLLLAVVAGLGVLNTVLLDTRERVHDLGVLKALGMSPRQTVGMVVTSVCGSGLVAGLIGVPIGIVLHHQVMPAMARAAGVGVPEADLTVFDPSVVGPLILGGLVLALLGALPPATWAARTRTATALRTE
ncbi:putative ABC transport system permease protein [Kitasatospora sp. MAA19]|uniref:FtsX-like permease family protein n=1 Tax=unclassified Kitasatospora TaxID=2633591 RepID=UPI0024767C4F|nr:ABC transporter permease [Kitasatospora sp. MAA19]MDH6703951.1 putative ABC transport system permease protein [Kitasatospora sp. MAA19]